MGSIMKTKLDKAERAIEQQASSFRPVSGKKLRNVQGILARARKTRNINIRLSEETLAELKRRSQKEGLPYQTLISSVLHKFVTDQLVDEDTVARSIHLLRSTG
jgi:predicted DNA binding CopG/RHH family protein